MISYISSSQVFAPRVSVSWLLLFSSSSICKMHRAISVDVAAAAAPSFIFPAFCFCRGTGSDFVRVLLFTQLL